MKQEINKIPEDISEYLSCDFKNGILTWIKKQSNLSRIKIGNEAGTINNRYKRIKFRGLSYGYHRIIYYLKTSENPTVVDHIDGNTLNNSIDNLRGCGHCENNINSKIGRNNTSGHKGVRFIKKTSKWRAEVFVKKKCIYLGEFFDKKEAINARLKAEIKYYGKYMYRGEK